MSSLAIYISDRSANSHRKTGAQGRLHLRPIQWHLKNNWRVPETLQGQPLSALQIFTDASKEGWGAHLNEHTARETWSLPESKLHIKIIWN